MPAYYSYWWLPRRYVARYFVKSEISFKKHNTVKYLFEVYTWLLIIIYYYVHIFYLWRSNWQDILNYRLFTCTNDRKQASRQQTATLPNNFRTHFILFSIFISCFLSNTLCSLGGTILIHQSTVPWPSIGRARDQRVTLDSCNQYVIVHCNIVGL